MKLDEILEFLFRKIGGVIIATISSVLLVLSLSGCLCVDCFNCLCVDCLGSACGSCSACVESCPLCDDCGSFCADCLEFCAVCFVDEACIEDCIESLDERKVVGTYTWTDYYGDVHTAILYENETYLYTDTQSVPFMELIGFFSGENGSGVQYSRGIELIEGIAPVDGSTIYPHYKDQILNSQLYIRPVIYTQYGGQQYLDPIFITLGSDISDYLPRCLALNGEEFIGWSTYYDANEEYRISDENVIYDEYIGFYPRNYPDSFLSSAYTEKIDGEEAIIFNIFAIYQATTYVVEVQDSADSSYSYRYQSSPPFTLGDLDISIPSHDGYVFLGLCHDTEGNNPCDMDAVVTSDMLVYAVFKPAVTMYFYDEDEQTLLYTNLYPISETVTLPTPDKPGYEFVGWKFTDSTNPTTYTELGIVDSHNGAAMHAVWEVKEYNITYMMLGNALNIKGSEAYYYFGESKTLFTPVLEDYGIKYYVFDGWYDNELLLGNPVTEIYSGHTGDMTFYAKLVPQKITVYGDSGIGSDISEEISYGEKFYLPPPTRNNYTFLGWYCGDIQITYPTGDSVEALEVGRLGFTEQDMLNGYKMVTAKWIETTYTVRFMVDDTVFYLATGIFGDSVNIPIDIPTKEGYNFAGWYYGGSEQTDSLTITGHMDLVAVFEPKTYTIYLYTNDGTEDYTTATYSYGDTSVSVTAPSRDGYLFTGWCLSDGSLAISSSGSPSPVFPWNEDGLKLYARWN